VITAYEVWPEPNEAHLYAGTVQQMVALAATTRQVLDTEDTSAVLLNYSAFWGPGQSSWLT
jgi:hypothetical protein